MEHTGQIFCRPRPHRWAAAIALGGLLGLMGCGRDMPVGEFPTDDAVMDPIAFFTGHVRSWGVIENRSGAPNSIITTDCIGEAEGDGVRMRQELDIAGEAPRRREWRMHPVGSGRYEATATDIVGIAVGEAHGRAFHLRYTMALEPGNSLKNVTMDQWMYRMADGSMVNRGSITKLGVQLAQVTEHFAHTDSR